MKKSFTAKKHLPVALALAALTAGGTAPALAQSAGTWGAGIAARNVQPYVRAPSSSVSGYSAYAQAPATIQRLVPDYRATVPSRVGPDPFGLAWQRQIHDLR
ncbi:MAG: hypothetical protein WAV38_39365 [Xanthobacteraceae bacterium]